MSEFVLGLLCVAVGLAIVAVVGHGLWVAGASIVRWLSGAPDSRPVVQRRPCTACGAPLGIVGGRCGYCGFQPDLAPIAQQRAELETTARVLAHWANDGLLATEQYAGLQDLLARQRAKLAEGTTALEPLADFAGSVLSSAPPPVVEPLPPVHAMPAESGIAFVDEPLDAVVVEPPAVAPPPTEIHPLDREYADTPTVPAPTLAYRAQRRFADVLQAFMEEKNIRWGEVMAGALIVVSAIGGVFSLQDALRHSDPYVPAFLFLAATAAIYGAGTYTLRRWDLQSVSRAILIIALLLVPLNFLAATTSEQRRSIGDPIFLLAVAVGLSAFGAICWFACRTLVRSAALPLTLAVMGAGASQLAISRLATPQIGVTLANVLFAVPAAFFLGAVFGQTWKATRWTKLTARRAEQTFIVAGVSAFSLAAAGGLLVYRLGDVLHAMAWLSPSLAVVAGSIVALGLSVAQLSAAPRHAPVRTAALAMALLGASMMAANVLFAWPDPRLMIVVGAISFATLAGLAATFRQPALHGPALVCLTLAYVVGFQLWQSDVYDPEMGRRLLPLLWMGRTSAALGILAVVSSAAGAWLQQRGRGADALYYLGGGGALGAISALLAVGVGFFRGPDADWATAILGVYTATLVALAVVRRLPGAAALASLLMLAALVHGIAFNQTLRAALGDRDWLPPRPVLSAALLHALTCVAIAAGIEAWRRRRERDVPLPSWNQLPRAFELDALRDALQHRRKENLAVTSAVFAFAGCAVSVAGAPFSLYFSPVNVAPNVAYCGLVALVWLAVAWLHRWPAMLSAFGGAATVTLTFAVTAFAQRTAWWDGTLLHPRHLQLQFAAWALWSLIWTTLQRWTETRPAWRFWLAVPWPRADQAALGVAVAGSLALAAVGCLPGVRAELGLAPLSAPTAEAAAIGSANHALIYDGGGWAAWALVAAAVGGALAARISLGGLVGIIVALATVPLLAAAPWNAAAATASALRWWFALYGIAMAAAVCARDRLSKAVAHIPWMSAGTLPSAALELVRSATFVMTLAPVLGFTLWAAVRFLGNEPLGGPAADSLFGRMPAAALYAGPLAILVGILIAYALREKSSRYLGVGSVLFQTTATLACLLALAPRDDAALLRVALLQWNAVALGAFSWLWLVLAARLRLDERERTPANLLGLQLGTTLVAMAALGAWAALGVFVAPVDPWAEISHLGAAASYLGWLLAVVAGFAWARTHRDVAPTSIGFGGAAVLGALAAASMAGYATPQAWVSYYVLAASWVGVSIAATAWAFRAATAARWAATIGAGVLALAMGAAANDPWRPWWSAAPTAILALCAAALAVAQDRRVMSYVGTGLSMLAASFVAVGPFIGLWLRDEALALLELVDANLLAALAAGGVSLAYFLRTRSDGASVKTYFAPPVHATVAVAVTAVFALVVSGGLLLTALDRSFSGSTPVFVGGLMGWCTAVALGALLIASGWEARTRCAMPCLYVWGAVVVALVLDQFRLSADRLAVAVVVSAASYVMLTGLLWRSGIGIAKVGARLGIPEPVEGLKRVSRWLPGANAVQAVPWTLAALAIVLTNDDRGLRYAAALAPLLLAIGVGSLAQLERRGRMQFGALLLATAAAVFLGWADIAPDGSAEVWLTRCVRLLIVLSVLAAFYGGVLIRLLGGEHAWSASVRKMTVASGAAALTALAMVLSLEWLLFEPNAGVPGLEGPQIFAVAVALVGLIAALLSLALFPQRDPLALSEKQRMGYVYAAELIGAILFAHLYMTMPQLFSGLLRDYWTYIVVAIAYGGVGLGELFRRWGVRVLAEPLGRTGVFLPLLPALAFWAQASLTSYAGVLFWVGLLYVVLSIQHKSFAYGLAAGLAGNGALWALMQDGDFTFWEHPQFWLIPPAVSVLAAAQLTRNQLNETQLAAIRYGAMLVIYLSSTGEMFIAGIGESLWPVMALAALSVAGVLVGIGLRVRAFLYLGAGFLSLSLLSMVWHASRTLDNFWPWWAFLFVLGVAILAMFALFEKRRDLFVERIEQLSQWER